MDIGWRGLLAMLRPHRKRIMLGQVIALLAVLVSLPVPLLFPLLIDEVLLAQGGTITSSIDRLYVPSDPMDYIIIVFGVTLALRIAFFLLNVLQTRLFTKISKAIVFTLRQKLLRHLERVSVAQYESLGGGGVSAKMVTDINTLDTFIATGISKFLISSLSLIGISAILFYLNWQLALILLTLNPTVVTLTTMLGRKVRELKKTENLTIERFQNALSETLEHFIQIRAHNQERRYIERMIENARAIREASGNFGWKSEASSQLSGVIFLAGFELLRASSMVMVLWDEISIGEMFAIMGYLWFMITPLQELIGIIFSFQNAKAAIWRLEEIMALEQEPCYETLHNPFEGRFTNSVELRGVSFAYGVKEVLHGIDMVIPQGKTVALLGASGSGKTTLSQVILGLYAIKQGDILIDGISIREIGLGLLRDHIALVLQSPRLFNDTLRHNLTFGREIEDERLWEALRIAQFEHVVLRLSDGLESRIGKEGIRLSGGERQRLAIARMLVHEPNIVILDESTSALDVQTETNLFEALRAHLKGKTMIVIAHRLSTIRHADWIYALENGRVVQSGSPEALEREEGYFRDFVTRQHLA
ncbi:MAG: ABC transporter ATP-binding protein [Campylobacterales bacterium]|nr:ABC transporter ATP-binding protein [Campylobacterales bacterium]